MNVRFRSLSASFDAKEFISTVRDQTTDMRLGDSVYGDPVIGHVRIKGLGGLNVASATGAGLIKGASGMAALVTGYANTPKKVEATDGSASVEEVRAMLSEGKLQPTDLVEAGGTWRTFAEHPEFAETCDDISDTRSSGRTLMVLIGIAAAIVAVVAMVMLN